LRRRLTTPKILVLRRSQILDGIGSFASMVSLGEMVQATEDHLQRNTIKGSMSSSATASPRSTRRVKNNQVAPDLQEDAVFRTRPQVSQVEQAFDGQESFLDSPAPSIQIGDYIGWQEV